jgi:preprotein translocase subunit YajC
MMVTLFALAGHFQTAAAPATGGAPAGGPLGGCGGSGMQLFPLFAIFAVMYLILIRPQQKKQREQQEWLKSLKKGDEVVTTGGMIGKITGLTDNTVTLEVQEKVRLKVLRSAIAGKPPQPGQPAAAAAVEPEKK